MKIIDKKRELENCNFVKLLLMMCVVLGHSVHFWTGDWFTIINPVQSSDALRFISHFISGFHVYAFAMVSGYIFYYLRIEMNRYSEWKPFVINKVKRLIVPYVFVSAVYLIPVEIYLYGFDLEHITSKFVLAISPSHLWFLWMLFDVFMIAWPMSSLLAKIGGGGGY